MTRLVRVLFVPLYPRIWASSRYRGYLWAEALKHEGFPCRVLDPPTSPASRAGYYATLFALAPQFDIVFIQKKLFPVSLLRLLRLLNSRLVFDFDDALFTRPTDLSGEASARRAGEQARRLNQTLLTVRLVVAGNRYLAEYAQRWNPHVAIIPTAVDLERLPPLPARRPPADRVVIGWTGRSATLCYLDVVAKAFVTLQKRVGRRFLLRVVADRVDTAPYEIPGVPVENVVWTPATEYTVIDGFDIGVMPLLDDPWSRGKCGFKLLQCMSRAVSVVASPVGVNREIVQDGANGFLAASETEWREKLATLIEDPALQVRLGEAGRETVAAAYSFRAIIPKLADLLSMVGEGRRPETEQIATSNLKGSDERPRRLGR